MSDAALATLFHELREKVNDVPLTTHQTWLNIEENFWMFQRFTVNWAILRYSYTRTFFNPFTLPHPTVYCHCQVNYITPVVQSDDIKAWYFPQQFVQFCAWLSGIDRWIWWGFDIRQIRTMQFLRHGHGLSCFHGAVARLSLNVNFFSFIALFTVGGMILA